MAKGLIWSTEAQDDRKSIFEYWNNRNKSKQYSRKLNKLFNENLQLLSQYPQIGVKTDITNVYTRVVKDYRIVYLNLTLTMLSYLEFWTQGEILI